MTYTMNDYYNDLRNFYNRNEDERITEDSTCAGETHRKMLMTSKETWYEVSRPVWEQAEVEVKGITVKVDVRLIETEWWTDTDSKSKKMYSRV